MSNDLSHPYFPAFSTREHELRAYASLDDGVKDAMLPVVMLTRAREAVSFAPALESILEATNGRPLIIDFDSVPKTEKSDEEIAAERRARQAKARADGREPRPATAVQEARWAAQREATREFNETIRRMAAPTDGYALWRTFAMAAPNIIPQARLDDPAAALAQVEAIVSAGRKVAFRLGLRNPASVASFLYAARGLGNGEEAIVLLDAGYIRDDLSAGYRRVEEALDVVRRGLGCAKFDAITKVCMSGSFPTSLRDVPTSLRILERDIHQALVRKGWDVRYGDHASVHQRVANMVANGWFPHVDVAHGDAWHFDRSATKRDSGGYVTAARHLVSNAAVWDGRSASWGTDMVERAARGLLTDANGRKLTSPGPWIGVRVSQHLSQQAMRS